jgi:hypothetical protein
MGQYIKFRKEDVKIGTCENCYYITFQQMAKHAHEMSNTGDGSPDSYLKVDSGYRFRFPFQDEINSEPFAYDDFDKGFLFKIPAGLGVTIHHEDIFTRVGFQNHNTHNKEAGISIPCPQSEGFSGRRWHNDGILYLEFTQQKYVTQDGKKELQTVARCPYCGASSRLTREEVDLMLTHYRELHSIEVQRNVNNTEFKPQYLVHIATLETALLGYSEFN